MYLKHQFLTLKIGSQRKELSSYYAFSVQIVFQNDQIASVDEGKFFFT